MADTTNGVSPRKLPPISPRSLPSPAKPKKKKRPVSGIAANGELNDSFSKSPDSDAKPIPSPRRNSSRTLPPLHNAGLETSGETEPAKKKKKKKKANGVQRPQLSLDQSEDSVDSIDGELDPVVSQTEGGQDETAPKKKKKKKKKPSEENNMEEFLGSTLLNYLGGMEEDVVVSNEPPAELPNAVAPPIIRSQPVDKLFVETDRKFKAHPKNKLPVEKPELSLKEEQYGTGLLPPQQTSIEFAISTQQVWKSFCLFVHGLTAGIGLWQIVIVYVFSRFGELDFLEHYRGLAFPVHSLFYALLVICVVSSCDRYDISNLNRTLLMQAVTMQSGAISVLIYLLCIILSVSIVNIDDKMHLHSNSTVLFHSQQEQERELSLWKTVNLIRGLAAILGWLVLAIFPNVDRLSENLSEGTNNILGSDDKLQNPSSIA